MNTRTGDMIGKHEDHPQLIQLDPLEQPPEDPMRDRVFFLLKTQHATRRAAISTHTWDQGEEEEEEEVQQLEFASE